MNDIIIEQIDYLINYIKLEMQSNQHTKALLDITTALRFNFLFQLPLCNNYKNGILCDNMLIGNVYLDITNRKEILFNLIIITIITINTIIIIPTIIIVGIM